jgi:hypothetical protein
MRIPRWAIMPLCLIGTMLVVFAVALVWILWG